MPATGVDQRRPNPALAINTSKWRGRINEANGDEGRLTRSFANRNAKDSEVEPINHAACRHPRRAEQAKTFRHARASPAVMER